MSYEEYKEYARLKGFQPLSEKAFDLMVKAGFDFRKGDFN